MSLDTKSEKLLDTESVKFSIMDLLNEQGDCSLEEICERVRVNHSLIRNKVLPVAVLAIAALQTEGKIEGYPQPPIDDSLEYRWIEVQGEN